jgi:hypothetical protein
LAPLGFVEGVEIEAVDRSVDRFDGADARAGGLDGVLAERELIEQDRLGPLDLAQRDEELECLDQMDRADRQIVVPLAPVT